MQCILRGRLFYFHLIFYSILYFSIILRKKKRTIVYFQVQIQSHTAATLRYLCQSVDFSLYVVTVILFAIQTFAIACHVFKFFFLKKIILFNLL